MSKKANLTIIIQTKNENIHREIQEKMIKKFIRLSKGLGLQHLYKEYYKKPSDIKREKIKKSKNKLKKINNNTNNN